nr:hypothetical protein [Tanacetum cinerariifolium]
MKIDSDLNNQNDQWELNLDIDDFDLKLTPVLRPCSNTCVESSTTTQKPVRIIFGPAGIVQPAKLLKQTEIHDGEEGFVRGWDIKNFLENGKLSQVVAIVKSCSPNVIGDLTVTLKDLSGTILVTIHHKVNDEGGYRKDITVGAALILANVLVFSSKPSMHYLNITMRNVVKVFRKDAAPGSGSGVCGSEMLMEEEGIVNLMKEKEMVDLELQSNGNAVNEHSHLKSNRNP